MFLSDSVDLSCLIAKSVGPYNAQNDIFLANIMRESNRNLDIPPPGIPPGIWILTFWSDQIPYIYL